MGRPVRRSLGQAGEDAAARHLEAQGYRILARNFRRTFAELDIVAQKEGLLVFVEVKTRSSARFGAPAEAVTLTKQRRLSKIALDYMMQAGLGECTARFDVLAVLLDSRGLVVGIEQIENAFDAVL